MAELDLEKTRDFLVDFLKRNIGAAGFDRAVVGLSGGVDSSLSFSLAVKALGADNVRALFMPYTTSHPDSHRHAKMMADRVGASLLVVEIAPQVDPYYERFPEADALRRGNKMARERMSILFDHSAQFNGLVVGTSNRTEILLGYGTLFGDTACSINPLGHLYKTQVFALARFAGVPDEIVDKPPTADLWAGQTDEGELGFTYADVDRLLHQMIDRNLPDAELKAMGFDMGFITKVKDMVARFAFKSRPPLIARIPEEFQAT